jgi:hypothetical protein
MAQRVDEFPPLVIPSRRRYPDEWFDGSMWALTPGVDNEETDPAVLRDKVRSAAQYRGRRLRTRLHAGELYIQAH